MRYQNSEVERIRIGQMRIGVLLAAGAAFVLIFAAAAVFPDTIMDSSRKNESERVEILNQEYASGYGSSEPVGVDTGTSGTSPGTVYGCDSIEELEEIIRERMVDRTSTFTVRYQKTSNNDVLTSSSFGKMMDAVFAADDEDSSADSDYLRLSWTKGGYKAVSYERYVIYNFSFSYLTTLQQEKQVDASISRIAVALSAEPQTDSQKVKAVNDYIVNYVAYDNTVENRSAYDALAAGTTICRGYSLLAYRLLEEMGIPAKIITGESNGGPHAWNLVKVGGLWYNLDVTWNDTSESSRFYLKSDKDFSDHSRDAKFATTQFYVQYPMAAMSWVK
jgi:transglutaminase-like putative cysteine protease